MVEMPNRGHTLKLKYTLIAATILTITLAAIYLGQFNVALTAPDTHELELRNLTWVEVRSLMKKGKTTIIIPTAGTEQNGPHAVLGKHGYVVNFTALAIAQALEDTLVAPTVETVPEGSIDPPEGHMAFPGTISVPAEVFELILEHTARSLKAHGFKTILFLGDSGGNQPGQARVADKLNREWHETDMAAYHLGDYYFKNGQSDWLREQGYNEAEIGTHAGMRDISELLAVWPDGVRLSRLAPNGGRYLEDTGSNGDPTLASAEIGRVMLQLKIAAALRQVHLLRDSSQ